MSITSKEYVTIRNTGGAVDAYYWDFQDGNGEVIGSQTMTYQFTATGIFNVTVRAENSNGSDNAFIRIIANPVVPIISFTAFPDRVFASLNVVFTPVSTGGPVTDYIWDFGDGVTESYTTAVPVSHSYINAGSYTVRLTATGPYGTAEQISFINVDPYIPDIELHASSSFGDVPYTVFFDVLNSGAPIDSYSWNFDDGQGFITGFEKMTYTFTSPKTYQIIVEATGAGSTDSDSILIDAGPQWPLLDADFDFGAYSFTFEPDLFRGTSGSTANGSYNAGEGYLTIDMGYGGNRDHSGGWKNEFFVPGEYDVTVQFQYRLTTPGNYESDEYNEVLFAIDDILYGSDDDKDYLERIYDGGDTGWRFYSKKISLSPGMHTIILGGYNNKSTESAEVGYYSFDNVLITFFAITPPPDFYINAVPFYGSSTLSVDFTTVNTGGERSFWEWCFDDGSIIREGSDNAAYSYTEKGIYKVFVSTFGFGEFDEDYATVFVDQPVENCLSWWSADRKETDLFGNQDCVMKNGTCYRSGRMETSFTFDGMDDYVSVPYNSVYNFDPDGEFSISAWVRP